MKQKISELLDDELSTSDSRVVLEGIMEDRELRGVWERYHLIRAAMHRELDVIMRPAIADRIGAVVASANVVSMPRAMAYRRAMPRMARLAAGLAIAASVATVAIVSLQPPKEGSRTAVQARASAGRAADRRLAAASLAAGVRQSPAGARTERASYQDALNAFLVEHGEVTPPAGMNGMMSFVRVVGYRNENSRR
ncbi:MAG: sigma-E factor negative regulatory protein [Pseudomonadota bacterium]|nr:sigma-E factor negative regulatory protein [Pseudomonadota bacterium]